MRLAKAKSATSRSSPRQNLNAVYRAFAAFSCRAYQVGDKAVETPENDHSTCLYVNVKIVGKRAFRPFTAKTQIHIPHIRYIHRRHGNASPWHTKSLLPRRCAPAFQCAYLLHSVYLTRYIVFRIDAFAPIRRLLVKTIHTLLPQRVVTEFQRIKKRPRISRGRNCFETYRQSTVTITSPL